MTRSVTILPPTKAERADQKRLALICAALTGITQGLNAEALTDVQYRTLARRAVRFADEVLKEIHQKDRK